MNYLLTFGHFDDFLELGVFEMTPLLLSNTDLRPSETWILGVNQTAVAATPIDWPLSSDPPRSGQAGGVGPDDEDEVVSEL